MMAKIPKSYTVKQDGRGGATVVKKPWGKLSEADRKRKRGGKSPRPQRGDSFNFGRK